MKKIATIFFTTANATDQEGIPRGYIDKWKILNEEGIQIFALRDNPRFPFDVPSCIEKHGETSSLCTIDRETILPNDIWDDTNVPNNVHYIDLSDYFCVEDVCKPVVDDILIYRDKHHITATFAKSLAPVMQEKVYGILEN